MDQLPLDTGRLLADLDALATFVESGMPGWTRRVFSSAFVAGRAWLAEQMRAAGLAVTVDAAGNLVGRRAGSAHLPPLVIGSHTDTVPGAGRFDGMLGVLAGVAVARALDAAAISLRHPLEVIDFLAEEPTPFGLACIGSAALVGEFDVRKIHLRTPDGRTLADALAAVGGDPERLAGVARSPGDIAAYLELHIEQGRTLEVAGAPLGVVRGIVGIRRATLRFEGRPDHAGTTPMGMRHDALAAAAEAVLAVERAARQAGDAVGTVGALRVLPNQTNVVPGAVELSVEVRSLEWPVVEHVWAAAETAALAAGAARGVGLTISGIEDVAPMPTPAWLVALIAEACAGVAPGTPTLPSGAGHDGSWVGRIAPAGMIFVRSRDGRSHCPEEFSAPEDIAAGARALGRALLALDRQLDPATTDG